MSKHLYSLTEILTALFKEKNGSIHKRLIYDQTTLQGIGSKWIKLLFVLLPFAMYASIFNPMVFNYLGIAQAIVFYIILLVFTMQIVVVLSFFNNKKVLKRVMPSWQHYFPEVDLKMVLSSGVTPYVDFMKHYEGIIKEGVEEEVLHQRLEASFLQMEEENDQLVEAIRRDKMKKENVYNDE